MHRFNFKSLVKSRLAVAAGIGLLWAAAFPKLGLAGLAWFMPGLLLFCALGQSAGRAFRIGYVGGLAFNLAALHWLWFIPVPVAPGFGWLVLSAYLALYPAVWVWLCVDVARFKLQAANSEQPTALWQLAGVGLQSSTWLQRALWAFSCAVVWVVLEMVLGRLLTGFPWLFLGVTQYQVLPLIQVASFTGVYGVSFLIVWVSVSLLCAALMMVSRAVRPWNWMAEVSVPFAVVAVVLGFGFKQIMTQPAPKRELRAVLVQPSIPQTVKWDPAENLKAFSKVLQLSETALQVKPDVLIWPEAAVPNLLRYDTNILQSVTNLARAHSVWMILGADDAEPSRRSSRPDDVDYFNSSFLINPQGALAAKYDKRRLVIFGEYVPLARWLPFLKFFTPIEGGFTRGREPIPFELDRPRAKVAVLICFEDVFPHLAREYVAADTDFLVNLTNDGWFGESAEQWQHAANAVFRAVENGLPLVRCTNNGLTCWIDAAGRMHEVWFGDSPDIYGAGFKTARIPLRAGERRRAPTFYTRHGDWFGWSCVVLAVGLAGWQLARVRRGKKN